MSKWSRFAYTLLLCMPACVWISGCSKPQETAPATSSDEDDSMEPPTVTMPDEDAGDADSSATTDDGSSDG